MSTNEENLKSAADAQRHEYESADLAAGAARARADAATQAYTAAYNDIYKNHSYEDVANTKACLSRNDELSKEIADLKAEKNGNVALLAKQRNKMENYPYDEAARNICRSKCR